MKLQEFNHSQMTTFFEGSRSSAFKQIGNAVPVVLAEKIALEIKKILAHEDELRRTQNR
ncbi:DNA cytosine methyltransferase [Bacteroides thetaiotaomicron]|nr:DNA cytosine methyltransferase [Bacteroides thetaiotaomicron]